MKIKVTYYENGKTKEGDSFKLKGKMSTKEFVELAKKIPPLAKLIAS